MNGYGAPMMYGVPTVTWNSWDAHTQQLWLQDYNRTEAQATYYTFKDKSTGYKLAYTYTGLVDLATGLDASEIGANVNATVEDVKDKATEALDTGKDITILLAIGAALILLSK